MKQLILKPVDFATSIENCPPGLFLCGEMIGFKTEYGVKEAFCENGEAFCSNEKVIPLVSTWVEE